MARSRPAWAAILPLISRPGPLDHDFVAACIFHLPTPVYGRAFIASVNGRHTSVDRYSELLVFTRAVAEGDFSAVARWSRVPSREHAGSSARRHAISPCMARHAHLPTWRAINA